MTVTHEAPLYNIGVVARLTGVPASTLRIWERRYRFPVAARSAGRQRLYTQQEINRLRWVRARTEEGMQVSRAVRALRHLEAEGRRPETQPPPAADPVEWPPDQPTLEPQLTEPAPNAAASPPLAAVRERLYAHLLQHNLEQADEVLTEAATLYTPEQLMESVMFPILDEVGREWRAGRMNIASEHLMTHHLRQRMLLWLQHGPPPYPQARPVLLACAPGELHEGSLIMLGVLLRRRRCPIHYLGQDVPLSDLAGLVRQMQPGAVVFVAMTPAAAEALIAWPRHLPEAAELGRPIVAFGGAVFSSEPGWRQRVAGLWLGGSVAEGAERLEAALTGRSRDNSG